MAEKTTKKPVSEPSAFPAEAEVEAWHSLNREEQLAYMSELLGKARNSGVSSRSVDQIAESALAEFKAQRGQAEL